MVARSALALIDDDANWVETLGEVLSEHGYLVHSAHCGLAGIDLLQSFRPPVAVVDYHMPDMTGLEMIQKLRLENQPLPAVLLVSGDPDLQLPEMARKEGVFAFHQKTTPFRVLLRSISRAFDHSQN